MLETLNQWTKGALAEERAFQIYGGIEHPNLYGTIPDLQREYYGKDEFIEVKYINLGYYCVLQSRLCGVKMQMAKRKKFLPKGATQRLYILFDNPEIQGWEDEELMEVVLQGVEGVADSVDIEVIRKNSETEYMISRRFSRRQVTAKCTSSRGRSCWRSRSGRRRRQNDGHK